MYELRVQPFRVFFDVDEATRTVHVLAVVYKPRETAYRRGQEVDTHAYSTDRTLAEQPFRCPSCPKRTAHVG